MRQPDYEQPISRGRLRGDALLGGWGFGTRNNTVPASVDGLPSQLSAGLLAGASDHWWRPLLTGVVRESFEQASYGTIDVSSAPREAKDTRKVSFAFVFACACVCSCIYCL